MAHCGQGRKGAVRNFAAENVVMKEGILNLCTARETLPNKQHTFIHSLMWPIIAALA